MALASAGAAGVGPEKSHKINERQAVAPATHAEQAGKLEDHLADTAVALAADIRDNPAAARDRIRHLDRLALEQLTCVLAAFVPPNRAPRGPLRVLTVHMRDDVAAAHRAVRYMQTLDLRLTCLALAEVVPDDIPLVELAWWRPVATGPVAA